MEGDFLSLLMVAQEPARCLLGFGDKIGGDGEASGPGLGSLDDDWP